MTYTRDYNDFILGYKEGEVSAETIGLLVAKLTMQLVEDNTSSVSKDDAVNKLAATTIQGVDESGKAISAAKAEVLVKASTESNEYRKAKIEIDNLQAMITALRVLQSGVLARIPKA